MFKVPSNAEHPTFDATFTVGFFRWLTSSRDERVEWARRRNAASKAVLDGKLAVIDAEAAENKARYQALKAELEAERAAGGSEQYKAAKARLAQRFAHYRHRSL